MKFVLFTVSGFTLLVMIILGAATLFGVSAAVANGDGSLSGRAVLLLVNEFWLQFLGKSNTFLLMVLVQTVLGVCLFLIPLFIFLKKRSGLFIASGVFMLDSFLLDILRIGWSFEYLIFVLFKYVVYLTIGIILYVSFRNRFLMT